MKLVNLNNKGVSLPLTIGLLLLLILLTTTINELVIKALRASHQIEASDKAYFAAEAGMEDALYELSVHDAGYETQAGLGDNDVRSADFRPSVNSVTWNNEWDITGKNLNDCSDMDSWESGPWPGLGPIYCGRIYGNEKLVINLFSDEALSTGVTDNEVNIAIQDINTIVIASIMARFRLPNATVAANSLSALSIDNDGDLGNSSKDGPEVIVGLNEDGPADVDAFYTDVACPYSGGTAVGDDDCDSKEDEDSQHDAVIVWKLVDDKGRSFQPLRGCMTDGNHPTHPSETNSTMCEKDFALNASELSVGFSDTNVGHDNGTDSIVNLSTFLANYSLSTDKLQMEILVVAPMQGVDGSGDTYPIPYYEYGLIYDAGGDILPSTYSMIRSDGYYRDFKQSITTNVTPRASSRLLDLTIIQQ